MKLLFWISLVLPMVTWANESIDYFNESSERVSAPTDTSPPSTPPSPNSSASEKIKSWGQGALAYLEKLTDTFSGSKTLSKSPAAPSSALQPQNYEYLKTQLNLKENEIIQLRQQILRTQDGSQIQALTGTLHRLEGERQRLLQALSQSADTPVLSPMAVPTPPVEKIALPSSPSTPFYADEEDELKAQLMILIKQETDLQQKIKATADSNDLSTLASQLERVQQNKSLVELSIRDIQKKKLKHSKVGFGAALLPPTNTPDVSMPIASLTPSLQQVMAPNVLPAFPMPAPSFKAPPAQPNPTQPTGIPITGDAWKKVGAQAEATFADKNTHTTYRAPNRPLWTPKDQLGAAVNRKPLSTDAQVDRRLIIEKIQKQKIF